MCMPHWQELSSAIIRRGLGDLVATTGGELIERLVKDLRDGATTLERFDPLMSAHNLILAAAIKKVGLAIFSVNEDGSDICPLCHCAGPYATNWIDGAADDTAEYAASLVTQCETTSTESQQPPQEDDTPE